MVYEWFPEMYFIDAGNAVLLCYLHQLELLLRRIEVVSCTNWGKKSVRLGKLSKALPDLFELKAVTEQ